MSDKVKVTFTYDQKKAYKVIKNLYRKVPKSDRRPLEFDEIAKVLDTKEYFKFVTTIGTLGDSSRDQAKVFRHFINFKGLEPAAAAEKILTEQLDVIVRNVTKIATYKEFVKRYKDAKGDLLLTANDYYKQIMSTFILGIGIKDLLNNRKKLVKLKSVVKYMGGDDGVSARKIVDTYFDKGKNFFIDKKNQITGLKENALQLQWVKGAENGYKIVDGTLSIVDKGIGILSRVEDAYQDKSFLSFWLLFATLSAEGLSTLPMKPPFTLLKIVGDLMGLTFTVTDFAGEKVAAYNRFLENKAQKRNKFSRVDKSILIDRSELCSNSSSDLDVDSDGCSKDDDDKAAPTFSSAATNSDGTKVVLTYNEALDSTTAAASAFAVTTDGAANAVTAVAVSGSTVELTLTNTVKNDQAVTVAYNDPTSDNDINAVQDSAGNDAASLTSTSVTNSTVKDSLLNPDVFDKVEVGKRDRTDGGFTYVASPLFDELAELKLNREKGAPLMVVPSIDLTNELLLRTPDTEDLTPEELEAHISSQLIKGYYPAKYFKYPRTKVDNHEVIGSTDANRPHNYSFPDKRFYLRTDIRNASFNVGMSIEVQHADREEYKLIDGSITEQTDELVLGPFLRWTDHELNPYYQYNKEGIFKGFATTSFRLVVNTNSGCSGDECTGRPIIVKLEDGTYLNLGHSETFEFNINHFVAEKTSIASATYDLSTGVLFVTGTNIEAQVGDNNDIDISKIAITGEGGSSEAYTLTSSNVERISETSFSATLNAADQLELAGLLNKNGTSSGGGTTYNIAVASDWNPGANSSPADSSGNVITVSNVAAPTLISATYDDSSGVLTLTGSNLPAYPGPSNDINVAQLTITGGSNNNYTLTSTDVELTSATSASISLNSFDQTSLDGLLNKNGTSSNEGTTYNITADDDWARGADSSVDIGDFTDNVLTVSNVTAPPSPPVIGGGEFKISSMFQYSSSSSFRIPTSLRRAHGVYEEVAGNMIWNGSFIPFQDCNSVYLHDWIVKTSASDVLDLNGKATVTFPSGNTYTKEFTMPGHAENFSILIGPIPITDEISGWTDQNIRLNPPTYRNFAIVNDVEYTLHIPGASIKQGSSPDDYGDKGLDKYSGNLDFEFIDWYQECTN